VVTRACWLCDFAVGACVFNDLVTVHDLIRRLPDPDALKARCRAFAVLDAVFDSGYPTYTFTPGWGGSGVDLAQMDNGSGDLYAIVFEQAGVFLYGFDHESEVSPWRDDDHEHWPGLLQGLPESLAKWTREPAFLFQDFFDATICVWRETADTEWRHGPVEFDDGDADFDGANNLFGALAAGDAHAYATYATDYFEQEVDVAAVAAVLAGAVLTEEVVHALNPEAAFAEVVRAAAKAGYPVTTRSWSVRGVVQIDSGSGPSCGLEILSG